MKYTVYRVDPNALAAGIPIDALEKKDFREVDMNAINPVSDPGEFQNTKHLYQPSELPVKPMKSDSAIPTIEVSNLIYRRILDGKMVKVAKGEIGGIYKIINKENGNFVTRQIYQLGEYKYLKRVV